MKRHLTLLIAFLLLSFHVSFSQTGADLPVNVILQDGIYYELILDENNEMTGEANVIGWTDDVSELRIPEEMDLIIPDELQPKPDVNMKGVGDNWPTPGHGSTRKCRIITLFTKPGRIVPLSKRTISLIELAASLRIEGNFQGFINLRSITLPNVPEVPDSMFLGCNALGELTVPKSVTRIGEDAFTDCYNMKTLSVNGNSSVDLCYSAFKGCTALSSAELRANRIDLSAKVFEDCENLTDVTISGNQVSFYGNPFVGCKSLSNLYITDASYQLKDGLIINKSYSRLEAAYPSTVKNVVIPPDVKYIGDYAFEKCENLRQIYLPYTIQAIGNRAFAASGLESLDTEDLYGFTDDYVSGSGQFEDCQNLQVVRIGKNFKSLNPAAFANCNNLTKFQLDPDNAKFSTDGVALFSLDNLVACPPGLSEYSVPEGTERISGYAFCCSGKLKTVNLPNSLWTIWDDAFSGCTALETIVIPDNVMGIYSGTFNNCTALKSITFGKSISGFRDYCMSGCSSLTTIKVLNPVPPTAYYSYEEDDIIPAEVLDNATLYVPDGSIETYRTSSLWGRFSKIAPLSSGIGELTTDYAGDKIDYSSPYDVYTLSGVKIGSDISGLQVGLYLIRQGGKTIKIAVR